MSRFLWVKHLKATGGGGNLGPFHPAQGGGNKPTNQKSKTSKQVNKQKPPFDKIFFPLREKLSTIEIENNRHNKAVVWEVRRCRTSLWSPSCSSPLHPVTPPTLHHPCLTSVLDRSRCLKLCPLVWASVVHSPPISPACI